MAFKSWWPEKKREWYFMAGVVLASMAASNISNRWNLSDQLPTGVLNKPAAQNSRPLPRKNVEAVNPSEYSGGPSVGGTSYYRLGGETAPSVPKPAFKSN